MLTSDRETGRLLMRVRNHARDDVTMQSRRGLQPRDHKRGRVAVIALDLLSDFAFPDGPVVRRALQARAPAIRQLLARARSHDIPVIYANDNVGPWRSDSAALIARCVEPGRAGAALVRSLLPVDSDFIVLKPRHSAFFGTPLVALLDDLHVDTLILVGVSAESCVWMTASDAHTRGLSLIAPLDTMAGASTQGRRAAILGLRKVFGARTPSRASSLRFVRRKVA